MVSVVIDCSVFISAMLKDEFNPLSFGLVDKLVNNELKAVVPNIFFIEAANAILMSFRRNRITKTDLILYTNLLNNTEIESDYTFNAPEIIYLSTNHDLTTYDAAYLELALRRSCKIATLDKKLSQAAAQLNLLYTA